MAARRSPGPGGRFLRGTPPVGRRPGWPLLAAGAVAVILLTASALTGENGLATWRRLDRERAAATAEVEVLRARRAELQGRIEALRSDPAALERIAREKEGMPREGEKIIEILGDEHLERGTLAPLAPPPRPGPGEQPKGIAKQRPNFRPAYPPPPAEDEADAPGHAP